MAKEKTETSDFSDVRVTLKPLFGIRPAYYLPVIYLITFALIIFFVLFFPGINKHGTYIRFSTIPDKAPVYVDNKYVGSTPCTAFVKSGDREIKIKKPFYKEILYKEHVKGAIFGTLFFPLGKTVFHECELADVDGLLNWAIKDFAHYGMLKDFTANYQFPPLITSAVSAQYGIKGNISRKLYNFLHNAMYFVDSEQELWELFHGFSIHASKTKAFTPFSVIRMINDILQMKKNYDGFPCWISGSLPKLKSLTDSQGLSLYKTFINADWFSAYFSAYKEKILKLKDQEKITLGKKRVTVKGIPFISVPDTTYIMGDTYNMPSSLYPDMENLPHPVFVKSFYISETEVTNKDFYSFVKANPQWDPSNRERLEANELATGQYLSHWYGNSPEEKDLLKPVTNISFYSAQVFCEWLTKFLPSTLNEYSVTLPAESEWECVAKYIENQAASSLFFTENSGMLFNTGIHPHDFSPVKDIFGSVWEWCDNWFYPIDYPLTEYSPVSNKNEYNTGGSEKAVRGGCWANTKLDNIRSSTRGSQPPEWCTPYLGFRVVLSEKY